MSPLFRFAACDHVSHFERNGYVLIENGVSSEFLDFVRSELARCEQDHDDISPQFDKRGRKRQYLFEFPDDIGLIQQLVSTIGELTGLPADDLVISERHIKVYPLDARPDPPPHKDRRASQVAIGIPVVSPRESRLILYPHHQRSENVFDSYDEFIRSLPQAERPENALKGISPVVLDPRPGDVVVFQGSSIYHERMRAAGSKILYLKLNAMGLDPIGENLPMLPLKSARALRARAEPRPVPLTVEAV
jgi:hypothetical protein